MAIISISRIKHRRGISGTPGDLGVQLASAELGWAVDQQELYIGNGTIVEGAPAIGNTQILTEHSNLTALLSDYTYAGPFLGATMQTGVTAGSPIVRTNDQHDDDRVNVRSFGATGNGTTDDGPAIARAIDQHYRNQPSSSRYWTTIYFPAGTYHITERLQIPSRVRLVGDGFNSTIIRLIGTSANVVIEMERVGGNDPQDIYIFGIGFVAQNASSHVCLIANATDVTFDRCAFTGASAATTATGNHKSCVRFANTNTKSTGIKFKQCKFTGATYGINTATEEIGPESRQDVIDVTVESCVFFDLYKGIVIGFETGISPSTDPFPKSWRISSSFFDKITLEGIYCYKTTKFTSALNHFADVGNLQTATPTASNIVIGDSGGTDPTNPGSVTIADYENNYSIGDTFDRTDADNATIQRITTNCLNSYVIDPSSIRHGSFHVEPGRLIRLSNNTSGSTGITIDSALYRGAIIDYQLDRTGEQRKTGTFTIGVGSSVNAATHSFSEDFVEVDPTGVVFSSTATGGIITINHVTSDNVNDAIFSYSIRHLTCIQATP